MHSRYLYVLTLSFLFLLIISQSIFGKEDSIINESVEDLPGSNTNSYINNIMKRVEEQSKIPALDLQKFTLGTALHRIHVTKKKLEDIAWNYWVNNKINVGYIDLWKDNELLFISGLGKAYVFKTDSLNYEEINTNLDELINSFEYSDRMSVKDLLVSHELSHNERNIYISYIKQNPLEPECYSLAFAEGKHDPESDSVSFSEKLDMGGCIQQQGSQFQNSGGRMVRLNDDEYLASVGDFNNKKLAQDMKSPYGKLIKIDFNKSKYTIFTSGHRNPQGIFIDKDGTIYASEHGPRGGDELNIIIEGNNYGWPEISHGINYNGTLRKELSDRKNYRLPIYFWSPSIAVSEILIYYGDEFPSWKNNFLVTSLFEGKLHRLTTNDDKNIILSDEIIPFECRMRDIKTDLLGIIYILCEDPSILKIEVDENDYHY